MAQAPPPLGTCVQSFGGCRFRRGGVSHTCAADDRGERWQCALSELFQHALRVARTDDRYRRTVVDPDALPYDLLADAVVRALSGQSG